MNDSAGLIAFKVNGTLKAIAWGHHQHPAQIFLMNKPAQKARFVEQIQQIHPTGKSPQKSVKSLR
jgi:hypothetical protein